MIDSLTEDGEEGKEKEPKPEEATDNKKVTDNQQLSFETSIEQVRYGLEYKGHIKIDTVKFDYSLLFGVPLGDFDRIAGNDTNLQMRYVQLAVSHKGAAVSLNDKTQNLFYGIVLYLACQHYNKHPQEDGFFERLFNGNGNATPFEIRRGALPRTPQLDEILALYS